MPLAANRFAARQQQDVDEHLMPEGSYRLSVNGTLVAEGAALAWTPAKGGAVDVQIPENFQCVGVVTIDTGWILFTRITAFPGPIYRARIYHFAPGAEAGGGTLSLVFADERTPGEDFFSWGEDVAIRGEFTGESPAVRRLTFWEVGISAPIYGRRWTMNLARQVNEAVYPPYWNPSQFLSQPPLVFPILQFHRRLEQSPATGNTTPPVAASRPTYCPFPCNLKSGTYRLSMRYVTIDGHQGPWMPPTLPVWVSTFAMTPWAWVSQHVRVMGPSGAVTLEGLEWKVRGLDPRWYKAEFAYLYASTSSGVKEARLFDELLLDYETIDAVVQLRQNAGEPLALSEFARSDETILAARAHAVQRNRLLVAGVKLVPPTASSSSPLVFSSEITIGSVVKRLEADTTDGSGYFEALNSTNPGTYLPPPTDPYYNPGDEYAPPPPVS